MENIASGRYGTFRPLYICHRFAANTGETRAFLDWLTSDEGQTLVEKCGTVNLKRGVRLPTKFKHWATTESVTNYDELMAAAAEADAAAAK